ncbi:branched-chain amino acid ABC transporter permease [Pseudorhodoplanes sp.]|uniref:branched-chain amino acid ABC transporter permease n=1 Tax=Pseudorhodoplanes sp. TaxID=1934341 RepID=UPI003D0F0129
MRYLFKTSYLDDIRLIQHRGPIFWYGLLALLLIIAPFVLSPYYVTQLTLIAIYAIVGVGLLVLTGYTGQISLGHAAFLGIGAYTQAILVINGMPAEVAIPAAILVTAAVGVFVGIPALRLFGIYLAIATLAFSFIIEEVLARWESVTGGNAGLQVPKLALFGLQVSNTGFYFLAMGLVAAVILGVLNLMRAPTGRAFISIRDSEIAARSLGVNLVYYKTLAFALSAGLTGLAGALYAHKFGFITPEQFSLLLSIDLLIMLFIGGVQAIHGAVFGAIFIVALPQFIAELKDYLPAKIVDKPGLQPVIFGMIMILFILFEPKGFYGRWLKIREYFENFPLYRRGAHRRQRLYMKSERVR